MGQCKTVTSGWRKRGGGGVMNDFYRGYMQGFKDACLQEQEQRSVRALADNEHTGEPVAWRWRLGNSGWQLEDEDPTNVQPKAVIEPLYTTSQQQRKPLTDEHIQAIAKEHIAVGTRSFEEFARRWQSFRRPRNYRKRS